MSKSKNKTIFTCQNCGAQRTRWEGKCSDCNSWNTFVEETYSEPSLVENHRGWIQDQKKIMKGTSLDQSLVSQVLTRHSCGISELDRVLGGGLAKNSFVLLGGAPGIGKSTLLLQLTQGLAQKSLKIFYVSGEESVEQTLSRAHRLNIKSTNVEIYCESNLDTILEFTKNHKPDILILDSIQTLFLNHIQSAPGSVSQVRECAGHLMTLAKTQNVTILVIGHVTKDGTIAGPKVLEHMVDTVLSFEGDSSSEFRLLRSVKNRFGSVNELGVFQMEETGLREVTNPSEIFLQNRSMDHYGSAIFCTMEGTRPILCEIQTLTVYTHMPMPRRTSVGIDVNRIHLLSAVLERHVELKLTASDLYVNVVGGLRISETASDLAICAAVISNETRKKLPSNSVFIGEVGLTGEIRPVSQVESRLKEAERIGFKNIYLPLSHLKKINSNNYKINLIGVSNIKELANFLTK